jgi:hypothetical protein
VNGQREQYWTSNCLFLEFKERRGWPERVRFFVGDGVGRKGLGGSNVVSRQTRMIDDDRVRGHSGAELAQHQFHRDTRSANHRLAAHDLRIDLDSLVRHGAISKRTRPL